MSQPSSQPFTQPNTHPTSQLLNEPPIDNTPYLAESTTQRTSMGRFNLAIIGGTGVGKSSLVNAVFGQDRARTGLGLPVTRGIQYYTNSTLGIWDFEGFEIGTSLTPADHLRAGLAEIRTTPANQQISVVWYCVLAQSARLTPADISMIRELADQGLPVVLVLTKVRWNRNVITGARKPDDDATQFLTWLDAPCDENGNPISVPVRRVIPTSAAGPQGKHGLSELVAETLTLAPEGAKDAFRVAQRLSLPLKRAMARPVMAAATAAAAAAAVTPIPVIADSVALAPIQLGMMGRIAAIYELEIKSMLSTQALAQIAAQITGKALARSFIKLIPGAGSVINASVASALTASTGEAWIRLCEQVYMGKVDLSTMNSLWKDYAPTVMQVGKKLLEQRAAK
ncbi:MAG: 50S ribosome-binding GTPase [Cellulomonadaceae bacterium]|jgi:uncharacterized protein (DUF697 family)|nr:50S ribosome-binding GTPase [Cellulomonadaceae bacterium]